MMNTQRIEKPVLRRAALMLAMWQMQTVRVTVRDYNRAPAAPAGHTELKPLRLKAVELRQLEAFLNALSGPIAVNGLPRSVSTP